MGFTLFPEDSIIGQGAGTVGPTVGYMFLVALSINRIFLIEMPSMLCALGAGFIFANLLAGGFFEYRAKQRKQLLSKSDLTLAENQFHHSPLSDRIETFQIAVRSFFGVSSGAFGSFMYLNAFHRSCKSMEDDWPVVFQALYLIMLLFFMRLAIGQMKKAYKRVAALIEIENQKLRDIYELPKKPSKIGRAHV